MLNGHSVKKAFELANRWHEQRKIFIELIREFSTSPKSKWEPLVVGKGEFSVDGSSLKGWKLVLAGVKKG